MSLVKQDLPKIGTFFFNNVVKDYKAEPWCLFLNSSAWAFWPPKAGIVMNWPTDGGCKSTEQRIKVLFRGCQRLETAAACLRTTSFHQRPLCPLSPPLTPEATLLPFAGMYLSLATIQLSIAKNGLFNTEWGFRAQCQKWGRSRKDAHGGDSAITVPPGNGHN